MDYVQLPNRIIICIDMKSFFASVSSIIRGMDPLKTRHAVVGDIKRSGSVVLAATPLLKKGGIKTGSHLFDIPKRQNIHVVNPSMGRYIKVSNYISSLVLQYVTPEDFHANGIDDSRISDVYIPSSRFFGKSQILFRDYTNRKEVELLLLELLNEVCFL
ncbi:type VI secretion protein ImpB [Priestia megaterium]|uniref:Y-family DNA polymerase n=1 Tax=Priestia megaterium TaxID=1404 RepID=UPI002B24B31F|nr:type VI secretion protein ImpB [Priestia megaterium]MEB2268117.1 type VI secretion protein ImpB [Priestia megaterium]